MFPDNFTYLATLVAFRDHLERLVAAVLEDLENRDKVGRLVLVQPLSRQPSTGPVSDRLLTRIRRMVEVAAVTPMLAPGYFRQLVNELLEVHTKHRANLEVPAWRHKGVPEPAEDSKAISTLPNVRANLALWARDTVNWLWHDLVSRVHPAARIKAAIDILAAAHPGNWFWLVDIERYDGALQFFRQALNPYIHGHICRAEMLARIAQLLVTDPSRYDFGWWCALHGIDTRVFATGGIEHGVLDYIWRTKIGFERTDLKHPRSLPPLLPVRSFDLTGREVEWGKGDKRRLVTLTLHPTPAELQHSPYLPGDTITALRRTLGRLRLVRRQFTVVRVEMNFIGRKPHTITITARFANR